MQFHHITGIKINTHTILEHTPPSPLRLPHITGIKNNTRTIGGAHQIENDIPQTHGY